MVSITYTRNPKSYTHKNKQSAEVIIRGYKIGGWRATG